MIKLEEISENKIIITSSNFNFDKKSYNLNVLGKFISKEEFDQIIDEVNKLISKSMKIKIEMENTSLSKFGIFVLFFSISMTILYIVLLYLSVSQKYDKTISDTLFSISVLLMSAVIIFIFLFSLRTFYSKIRKFYTLEDIIKSNLEKYLSYINNYFEGYLEWIYIPFCQNIEINIIKYIKEESISEIIEDDDNINNFNNLSSLSADKVKKLNTENFLEE